LFISIAPAHRKIRIAESTGKITGGYLHDVGLAISTMADTAPDHAFDREVQKCLMEEMVAEENEIDEDPSWIYEENE